MITPSHCVVPIDERAEEEEEACCVVVKQFSSQGRFPRLVDLPPLRHRHVDCSLDGAGGRQGKLGVRVVIIQKVFILGVFVLGSIPTSLTSLLPATIGSESAAAAATSSLGSMIYFRGGDR